MSLKLFAAFLLCGALALANPVSYSTAGSFLSSGTSSTTQGDATIAFTGIPIGTTVDTPTFSGLGWFTVTGTVGGNFTDMFTLTVSQSVPGVGTGTSTTDINGTITGNSSTIALTFTPAIISIGAVNYEFAPDNYGLNNPAVNSGRTTIGAHLISVEQRQPDTPEPTTFGMAATVLLTLVLLARTRLTRA